MAQTIFEQIKKVNEFGGEYWQARELAKVLEYADFGNFENVIKKAMDACEASGQEVADHFGALTEMVEIGSGAKREMSSYALSRYACYLIIQGADTTKIIIAKAHTYFAIQTRRQEVADLLVEDNKRVFLREEMKKHNKNLVSAAKDAGVTNYANFQDAGYMGLYGGMRQKDILARKRLSVKEGILDHMGSEELAANLFRATQTEAKLRRDNIRGQIKANQTHYDVGGRVRATIKELGGTMPEKLPNPGPIKDSVKRIKSSAKAKSIVEGKVVARKKKKA